MVVYIHVCSTILYSMYSIIYIYIYTNIMKAMSYQQCYLCVIRLNISVHTIAATLYLYTTDHLAHHIMLQTEPHLMDCKFAMSDN